MQPYMLSLAGVAKAYQSFQAVRNVSFDVPRGSIFGILGPNGAGKTSTIRIITCITRADAGTILFDGQPLNSSHTERIGYMPEERGLYKKMGVEEQLLYLGQLRGMTYKQAKSEIDRWIEKFDIESWRKKPIEDLSKGMQQKVQFISTVLHKPDLLILDEPFSGLDPVNATLIQEEIQLLKQNGTTILFSTHRMEQIEQFCEHIVLISQGRDVLKGEVKAIKQQYKQLHFELSYASSAPLTADFLANLPVSQILAHENNTIRFQLARPEESNAFLQHCIAAGLMISSFHEILPTFNEIFIRAVQGGMNNE